MNTNNTENKKGKRSTLTLLVLVGLILGTSGAALLFTMSNKAAVKTIVSTSPVPTATIEAEANPSPTTEAVPTPTKTTAAAKPAKSVTTVKPAKTASFTIYCVSADKRTSKKITSSVSGLTCPAGYTQVKSFAKATQTITNGSTKVTVTPTPAPTSTGLPPNRWTCPSFYEGDPNSADWIKCWGGMVRATGLKPAPEAISCTALNAEKTSFHVVIELIPYGGNFGKYSVGRYEWIQDGWREGRYPMQNMASNTVFFYPWNGLEGGFGVLYSWHGQFMTDCK